MENPLYANLTQTERDELSTLNRKLATWITHLEDIRKENTARRKRGEPSEPFDQSLSVSDQEHFRMDELQTKAYGRKEPYQRLYPAPV